MTPGKSAGAGACRVPGCGRAVRVVVVRMMLGVARVPGVRTPTMAAYLGV